MKYRLTENKLRGIIREAVKGMLSELDWKTYQNAAKKARDRWNDAVDKKDFVKRKKYADQMYAFKGASEKAFNKEYGTPNYKYTTSGIDNANHAWDKVGANPWPTNHRNVASLSDHGWNESYFDYDPENNATQGSWFENGDSHKAHSHYSNYPRGKYNHFNDMGADELFNAVGNQIDRGRGTDHLGAAKRGNQELKDYFNGNYEYQKGKGWARKDESISRRIDRIVSESLRRNLH